MTSQSPSQQQAHELFLKLSFNLFGSAFHYSSSISAALQHVALADSMTNMASQGTELARLESLQIDTEEHGMANFGQQNIHIHD